ncbi:MAG: UDP-N-acetylglucosamine 1-carboxyvinyltransferase [Clostridiales Family XIII bacterium]|nr:UDP-N-acetylglucosamine 1-carboxyvinyltransferase [Clostridiales Family XIII bacterium]
MAKFYINNKSGRCALSGQVEISGSKNAVLPILAAALLTDEGCEILDVPALRDVEVMCMLLRSMGAKVKEHYIINSVELDASDITSAEAPYGLVKKMRASILAMGPLLARTGKARIALPGGCAIGARPINLHLKGFRALGAKIKESGGFIEATAASGLSGANIYLDFPSVGATENIIMAAVMAKGPTVLENVAEEPEIVDLANFLNKMGARIKGAGTDTIKIEGVERLRGTKHTVIPDRIETGTYMLAAAITRSKVEIKNTVPDHVRPLIAKLKECGVGIEEVDDSLIVDATKGPLIPADIKTLPYPGFPTDLQPQFMAFLSTVKGDSAVIETVFEKRYRHVGELNRMGASIKAEGNVATIDGGKRLHGAQVLATDLRAGAALTLAALAAKGRTEISEIYHIERGYSDYIKKLRKLGVDIVKADDTPLAGRGAAAAAYGGEGL